MRPRVAYQFSHEVSKDGVRFLIPLRNIITEFPLNSTQFYPEINEGKQARLLINGNIT